MISIRSWFGGSGETVRVVGGTLLVGVALRELIEHRAMLQQARALGLESDPAVRRELEMLLLSRWWEREATPRLEAVAVTDAEVAAEYERQRERFTQPGQIRLAMLKLDVPANATAARREETRARLVEARERALKQPTAGGRGPAAIGFGTLAVDYSDDQASRYRGGDLGWLEPGNFNYHWPRPVLEQAFALPRGGVSDIIESDHALYLVMHVDSRPASVQPLERVAAALKQSLLVQKRQAIEQSIKTAVLASRPATVHTGALAAVELPASAAPLARSNVTRVPNPPNAALSVPATP
jgi:parvulin-like peptidyl-prolyl isomerase